MYMCILEGILKTIVVGNQKGGVGKSTTVHALGAGLALRGWRVLYVDLDPQGNLSHTLRAQPGHTINQVLCGSLATQDAIQKVSGGDLIPSSPFLSGADIELRRREHQLHKTLATVAAHYDACVIDTPPALGALTVNALTAADCLLIPAQADAYSLQAISQLKLTMDAVKRHTNPSLRVTGILLTRYNARSVLSRDMHDMIVEAAHALGTSVFTTIIREGVAIREAQATQKDIFAYAPKSNTALDYALFVDEFLKREPLKQTRG